MLGTPLGKWTVLVQATLINAIPVGQIIGRLRETLAERNRAEEDLRKKEHLLSESQRVAHIGSWSFDPTSQSLDLDGRNLRDLWRFPGHVHAFGRIGAWIDSPR